MELPTFNSLFQMIAPSLFKGNKYSADLLKVENFFKKRNEKVISIKREVKGITNLVFSLITDKGKYIFKHYSNKNRHNEIAILRSVKIPEVFLFTDNFRIEQYIEHDEPNLTRDLEHIARALAQFHKLNLQNITTLQDFIKDYIKTNQDLMFCANINKLYEQLKYLFDDKTFDGVLHMDPQLGNLLKLQNSIHLIDYEYSCRGNVLIDINNLFFESMANYETDSVLNPNRGLTQDQKDKFMKFYLEHSGLNLDFDTFKKKVLRMQDISHFLWFLWGRMYLISGDYTSEDFDYYDWTACRLNMIQTPSCKEIIADLIKELQVYRK